MIESVDPGRVCSDGPWTHRDISTNGIRVHIAHMIPAGHDATSAPLVIFVHGVGQIWWCWRHQMMALCEAGFHVVAVDLRGHGASDKPPRGYDGWTLADDITGLIRALGYRTATLVGHGEGGFVAWTAAYHSPKAVSSLVTVASPHPLGMRRAVRGDSAQRAAMLPNLVFNQIPRLAEKRITMDDYAFVARQLRARGGPNWPDHPDFDATVEMFTAAHKITDVPHLGLETQRWMFRSQFRVDGRQFRAELNRKISLPVLMMRGSEDPLVLDRAFEYSNRFASYQRVVNIQDCGHYPHMEQPHIVSDVLAEFLTHLE